MHVRDRISRIIHHTIPRISFSSMIQSVIEELCGYRLTSLPRSMIIPILPDPNPQEDDAKFFKFSKKSEYGPSRAGRLSKTFPEVPITFRVSGGNQNRKGHHHVSLPHHRAGASRQFSSWKPLETSTADAHLHAHGTRAVDS